MRPLIRWMRWEVLVPWMCVSALCSAQDLEPRRWTHLPTGTNVFAINYAYTTGDLSLDPVLRIEDAGVDIHTTVLGFTRYFGIADHTARIDVLVPLQSGSWDGLLDGERRSVDRDGLADPVVRLSTNLIGAPALSGAEFMEYRKQHPIETTVGAALEIRLPLGEYYEDKLINLGANRFRIAPQLGVLHTHGEWSYELTGSMSFFTGNDKFFGGNELEQDLQYTTQAHVVKTFGQGSYWAALGAAYTWGGESTVDDVPKDDEKSTLVYGASFGGRLGSSQSLRVGYARADTLTDTGSDTHSFALGWSFRF